MQSKKVKVIYFSLHDSNARQIELTWGKFFSVLFSAFVMILLLVSASLALFTNFYQNLEISSLSKLNNHLRSQLLDLGNKLTQIDGRIKEIEKEDDQLRIIADLPKIDTDTRDVGVGGFTNVNDEMAMDSKDLTAQIFDYQQVLDKMERRIQLTNISRDQIKEKFNETEQVMKHTPSIRPIINGQIRDKFGNRIHPILEKIKLHPGVDIAAERGTEVFASAAGRVEKVVTKYRVNRGYGRYVIIDHGSGLKTRYGHLSKILVREGQEVNRWQPIGLVGDTGLATGPHLHYEVIKQGKQVDPQQYIFDMN
ncbi:MAG: M23 family metallopeptidase [bacterium]